MNFVTVETKQATDFLSFKLSSKFVDGYANLDPPLGYKDAAGNSIGEIVLIDKYSRLKPDGTKERWYEVCRRVIEGTFSIQKDWAKDHALPWNDNKAQRSAEEAYDLLFQLYWSPPGRGMSAMGSYVVNGLKNSMPLQNCAVVSTNDMTKADPANPFCFLFDVGMLGVGIGTDTRGADKEFVIHDPSENVLGPEIYVVPDTREGWVESLRRKLNSYLIAGRRPVKLDTSLIRKKGSPIKTFGGVAPGPKPLEKLMERIDNALGGRKGELFNEVDIADIMNMTGICIVSGNVRRMAELILGKYGSKSFINLKNYDVFPERNDYSDPENPGWGHMSNNTVLATPGQSYDDIIEGITRNGEPGILWLDNIHNHSRMADPVTTDDWRVVGANPCLRYSTPVATRNGIVMIGDWANSGGVREVWDGSDWVKATAFSSGVKKTVTLKMSNNRELTVTPDHLLGSGDGFIEAGMMGSRPIEVMRPDHELYDINPYDVVMGAAHGDGTWHKASERWFLTIGKDDQVILDTMFATGMVERVNEYDNDGIQTAWFKRDLLLSKETIPTRMIPDVYHHAPATLVRGFLRGLYSANGSAVLSHKRVNLKTCNKAMAHQVMDMLDLLGIRNSIVTTKAAGVEHKNGYYVSREAYAVVINGVYDVARFAKQIGFLHSHKTAVLDQICALPVGRTKPIKVTSITANQNEEEVFDFTMEQTHYASVLGFKVHNCSEQFLESKECCTLADLHFSRIPNVLKLRRAIKYAFLYAKTVTLLPTHLPETNAIMQRNRRIGLSVSGVADFMDANGRALNRAWLNTGNSWVAEYDKVYSEWLCVRESIRTTTVKPTGTIGLLVGESPGGHWTPGGSYFWRTMRFPLESPIVAEYTAAGYRVEPDVTDPSNTVVVYFPIKSKSMRSERDVSIYEKASLAVDLQHYWSNNGVSVTISFREDEVDDVKRILEMYDSRLKSVSFLPLRPNVYAQAPFSEMTSFEYEEAKATLKRVDTSVLYLSGKEAEGESGCTNDTCMV